MHFGIAVVPGAGDSLNNLYFKGRANAAARIFHWRKADRIMVIGLDDGDVYREPHNLRMALVLRNVPSQAILMDTNGQRTFEAVSRVRDRFPGERILFISQQPHLERILFIARFMGLAAYGYPADKHLPYQHHRYHQLREALARVRAVLDCFYWKCFSG